MSRQADGRIDGSMPDWVATIPETTDLGVAPAERHLNGRWLDVRQIQGHAAADTA